jgi:N-acetyl-anhydromuramyl-L-alanine amidase AmpD
MRELDAIVVHGAWTRPRVDVGVIEIREWHKARGFTDIGYHFVIRRSGEVEKGRPVEKAGAHVKWHNATTIGICLVGGRDDVPVEGATSEMAKQELQWEFNYTEAQLDALVKLVRELQAEHKVKEVLGHRDYKGVTKRCPGFDVRAFFA